MLIVRDCDGSVTFSLLATGHGTVPTLFVEAGNVFQPTVRARRPSERWRLLVVSLVGSVVLSPGRFLCDDVFGLRPLSAYM